MDFVETVKSLILQRENHVLRLVSPDVVARYQRELAGFPDDYAQYLTGVGGGRLAPTLQIYDGLIEPDEVFDPDTAAELEGLLIFGDDYQGFNYAFDVRDSWRVVEIDPTRGRARALAESFHEFLIGKLSTFAALK